MTASRKPSLGQFIREAIEARVAEINVSLPCKVLSYDSAKNTVKLQPLLKRKRRDKAGEVTATSIPALQNVPVAFMRTEKAWFTLPVQKGDIGMVVFAQRSIKDWMGANAGDEVTPSDDTFHPLNGAWFYPGASPSKAPINPTNASHIVLHAGSGVEIHLGESGLTSNDLVAIGALVDARLSTVQTTFDTHIHPSGMGPTGTPASPIGSLASTKATKVKAK